MPIRSGHLSILGSTIVTLELPEVRVDGHVRPSIGLPTHVHASQLDETGVGCSKLIGWRLYRALKSTTVVSLESHTARAIPKAA